jgi:hypothetical protein
MCFCHPAHVKEMKSNFKDVGYLGLNSTIVNRKFLMNITLTSFLHAGYDGPDLHQTKGPF